MASAPLSPSHLINSPLPSDAPTLPSFLDSVPIPPTKQSEYQPEQSPAHTIPKTNDSEAEPESAQLPDASSAPVPGEDAMGSQAAEEGTGEEEIEAPVFKRRERKRIALVPEEGFGEAVAEQPMAGGSSQGPTELATLTEALPTAGASNSQVDAPTTETNSTEKESEDVEMILEEQVFVRKGVKEGKKRLVLIPDEDFSEALLEDVPISEARPSTSYIPRPQRAVPDLSTVSFSSRNLSSSTSTPIIATTFDGRQITFTRRKRPEGGTHETLEQKKETSIALTKLSKSMLDVPYLQMVKEIGKENVAVGKGLEADASNPLFEEELCSPLETSLWTDRYRPKKFTDLLGDERVHRAALLWLKEWDQCVFPKTTKTTAAAELKRERRKKRARDGRQFGTKSVEEDENPLVRVFLS
ncbi:hypothetical protein P7C70_g2579, partial [Phenoliferia sp. Uapishka_3]